MLNIALQYHELFLLIVGVIVTFSISKAVGTYIEEHVKIRIKRKHDDECSCPAMDVVKEDIPAIKFIQTERTKVIAEINAQLLLNTKIIERMDKNIDNIYKLFEEEWKDEIRALKARRISKDA